jgi:hypothetical protein
MAGCPSGPAISPGHDTARTRLQRPQTRHPLGPWWCVAIAYETNPDDKARVIEWVQRDGPPIHGLPARRCFGLRLLKRGLAMQSDLRFQPEGLRCTLRLPQGFGECGLRTFGSVLTARLPWRGIGLWSFEPGHDGRDGPGGHSDGPSGRHAR